MRVHIARIVGAHGIKGLVKVRAFSHNALDVFQYQPLHDSSGKTYHLRLSRFLPSGILLCHLDHCITRNDAEAHAGVNLYMDRSRLPELEPDTYYHADLEGLNIVDQQGHILGRIKQVQDHGAGTYMDVLLACGGHATLPFFKECKVDLHNRLMSIDPTWLIDTSNDRNKGHEPDSQP